MTLQCTVPKGGCGLIAIRDFNTFEKPLVCARKLITICPRCTEEIFASAPRTKAIRDFISSPIHHVTPNAHLHWNFFFFKSAIITVDINFHTPLHSQTFITFIRCGFFSTLCFGKLHWLFNRLVVLILVLSCHKHLMAAGIVREVAILKGNQRFSRENAWDLCQFNLRISGIKPIWRIIRMSFLKVPAFCIFTRYTWKYSCYNSETVPCVVVEILGISLICIWDIYLIPETHNNAHSEIISDHCDRHRVDH